MSLRFSPYFIDENLTVTENLDHFEPEVLLNHKVHYLIEAKSFLFRQDIAGAQEVEDLILGANLY